MKRILMLSLMLLVAGAPIFAQPTIKDENVEVKQVGKFSKISISSGFDVYISSGTEESVAVSASKKEHQKNIKVAVKNNTLYISYKPEAEKWMVRNLRLRAYISYKDLEALQLSGAIDAQLIDTWKADKVRLDVSGASDLRGKVEFGEAKIDLSGASDVTLSGRVGNLRVDASGASEFSSFDLQTDICDVQASGASEVRVTVQKELYIQASGASDVIYKGDASIRDINTSGASKVKKR